MKTQLIPLESHDDLISVRDRMSWAKTPRILLVWPKSERIALRPLDLKVLQRHASSLGAQLGLVTRRLSIRREAQALGIPVFNSTGEAQRKPWPERGPAGRRFRRQPRRNLRWMREQARSPQGAWRSLVAVRIAFFVLGVLAVLALVSVFVPQAQVVLSPETQIQEVTLPVQADPSAESVFITGSIPSRTVSVRVEGSLEKVTTGNISIPEVKAAGTVTFRNLTQTELTIPAGTVLTSKGLPGVRFVTTEPAGLPAEVDATVDVPVEAEQPGSSGNVEADAIQAIEGNLGLLLAATNPEPTRGGRDRRVNAPTEADRAQLREDLLSELETRALGELESELGPGDQFFPETLLLVEVLDESYSPPPGQPGRNLTLTLRAEFAASYASADDLGELATTVLNASVPPGFAADDSSLSFETTVQRRTDAQGVSRWATRVERKLVRQIDPLQATMLVRARTPETALEKLEQELDLESAPQIKLTPAWWPWMPLMPFRISVVTQ